jgi:glutamate synthase (NADPH/NADH) small chain
VDILEARSKPGGLNEYGIAAYKAVDGFAQREVDYILSIGGITIRQGQAMGSDFSVDDLKRDYAAVVLGLGLGDVNDLDIEGEELDGVVDAVAFIEELRQASDLGSVTVGSRTIVIGGGMTAIDAAVQSRMLGSDEVILTYRRGVEHMKASRFEQDLARVNGVVIRTGLQPLRILGRDGRVTGVEFSCNSDGYAGSRATAETVILPCDRVLKAIGQRFTADVLHTASGLVLEKGRIRVDAERRTSDERVWAGGDCIAGGEDLTVAAVQDGKLAAESIHDMLCKAATSEGQAHG